MAGVFFVGRRKKAIGIALPLQHRNASSQKKKDSAAILTT